MRMCQWDTLQNQIGEGMRHLIGWVGSLVLSSLVVGCAGGGPAPSPTQRMVTWTWTPGTCVEAFHLYEVVNGQQRKVITTQAARYQQRMVVRKSTWIVSGMCADGSEAFSVPTTLP